MTTIAKLAEEMVANRCSATQSANSSLSPKLGLRVRAALFGLAVGIVGVVLDLGMARLLHRFWLAELSGNVLTGVLAGYAMFRYSVYRLSLSKQRAAEIAYLNHHIRNALSVILFSQDSVGNAERLRLVENASERIQKALKQFASEDNLQLPTLTSDVSSTGSNEQKIFRAAAGS